MIRFVVAFVSLALFASLPTFASDGVIEINQASAIAGGVTPGDTAGFPVTLTGATPALLSSLRHGPCPCELRSAQGAISALARPGSL